MKIFFVLFLGTFLLSFELYPQSMKDLFLQLPSDFSPALNIDGKKALLATGEFVVKENKNGDGDYTLDTVTNNYMEYEYSYSGGDGGSASFEMKRFRKNNGDYLLVAARNMVNNVAQTVPQISVFDFANKNLVENKDMKVISDLNITLFFKKDIPESVASNLTYTSAISCDLDIDSPDKMTYNLSLANEADEKYLQGDMVVLSWTGNTFNVDVQFKKEN